MTSDKKSQSFVAQQLTWVQKRELRSIESRSHLYEIHAAPGTKKFGSRKILEDTLRIRISRFLIIALSASFTVAAQAGTCSNSTIKGTYAYIIHGQVFLPNGPILLIDGLAKTTYDGEGNLTELGAVAVNGNVAPGWVSNTGTYSVNPDCTGTVTETNGDRPQIHLQMIVAQSGNKIHEMVIDPGFATTSDGERVHVSN